jgi:protein TonB
MSALRVVAAVLSLMVHGSLALALMPSLLEQPTDALELGDGDDTVVVEQGIAIEGLAKLGDALETIDVAEIVPAKEAAPPKPQEEQQIDELRDVITSEFSSVEDNIVKTEKPPPEKQEEKIVELKEPPPPEEVKEVEPDTVQAEAQPEQVAIVAEQSSGEERRGGNAKAFGIYLGKINSKVQRAKVNPRTRVAGTVVMRFTIDTDGTLISKEITSSSGSRALDDAAIAALDRAAPFPPIPPDVSVKPLAFTQPFKFILR